MTTSFIVQPQRSDGRAFIPCETHQATSWAVVKIEKFTSRGVKREVARVVSRCQTRTQAEGLAKANNRAFAPTPREQVRKLGLRIIKE